MDNLPNPRLAAQRSAERRRANSSTATATATATSTVNPTPQRMPWEKSPVVRPLSAAARTGNEIRLAAQSSVERRHELQELQARNVHWHPVRGAVASRKIYTGATEHTRCQGQARIARAVPHHSPEQPRV